MTRLETAAARRFAVDVVRSLRDAGFQSLWAGGCVRDQLLGLTPKDYDVATNATPDQVQDCFGRKRTIAIGAAFGVVTVLGSARSGNVEVATFRRDAAYSDGRHPDSVTFSTAEEDAQRRDFTINGLFYDPLNNQVIDYVDGQHDLRAGIVRAIRDPHERFAEDRLRMLRAVRFAATFQFQLDAATQQAIVEQADEIVIVSAERIAAEMERMLVDPHRARAAQLLNDTRLLDVLVPEAQRWHAPHLDSEADPWSDTLRLLDALDGPTWAMALAALVYYLENQQQTAAQVVQRLGDRWRLAKHTSTTAQWLLNHEGALRQADHLRWSELQPILVHPLTGQLVRFSEAVVVGTGQPSLDGVRFAQQKLALPSAELDPPPLLTGIDLQAAGIAPGPIYQQILSTIRQRQLDQQCHSKEEALQHAMTMAQQHTESDS